MRRKRLAGVSAVVLAAVMLSGCSADEEVEATPDETTPDEAASVEVQSEQEESSADDPLQEGAMDDEAVCTAYGDVMTILENADLGLDDGRMETQEQQGWYRLATRVLDRLPASGDGAVSQAIADLQEVAPAIPAGAGIEPADVRSPEWYDAEEALGGACDDLDVPLAIDVFTGG